MQKTNILLASAFALILLGAGCSNTTKEETNTDTKSVETTTVKNNTTTKSSNTPTHETTSDELTLSGDVTDEIGTVNLTWSAPQELKDETEGWRLLYSKNPNPTNNSSWWFERGPSHFEKVWSDLPSGPAYIRLCAIVNDECTVFSNDLEVNIK